MRTARPRRLQRGQHSHLQLHLPRSRVLSSCVVPVRLCCCNEPIDSSWLRVVASYIRTRSSSEAPASRDSCAELVADTAKTQSHIVVLVAEYTLVDTTPNTSAYSLSRCAGRLVAVPSILRLTRWDELSTLSEDLEHGGPRVPSARCTGYITPRSRAHAQESVHHRPMAQATPDQ